MKISMLENALSKAFCEGFSAEVVPAGWAVSTPFADGMGDRMTFYAVETDDGVVLEDDGELISIALASGIPLDSGSRLEMLDDVLRAGGAVWDRESLQVRSAAMPEAALPSGMVSFVSSLIRAQEISRLSPERVRSTFVEDAREMLEAALDADFILEAAAEDDDNAPDIVARPRQGGPTGVVYLVSNTAKLLQALIRHIDTVQGIGEPEKVAAILESSNAPTVSRTRFEFAQNRGLPMSFFRGHEQTAIRRTKELISGR